MSVYQVTMVTLVEEHQMTADHVPVHLYHLQIILLLDVDLHPSLVTMTTMSVWIVVKDTLETDVKGEHAYIKKVI